MAMTLKDEDPSDKPGIVINVTPKLDDEFAAKVAQSVATAVEQAMRNLLFGLSLTDDERLAVELLRAQRQSEAVDNKIKIHDVHERYVLGLYARSTDNVDNAGDE